MTVLDHVPQRVGQLDVSDVEDRQPAEHREPAFPPGRPAAAGAGASPVVVGEEHRFVDLGPGPLGDLVDVGPPPVGPPHLLEHEHVGVERERRRDHVERAGGVIDAPMGVEAGDGELGHGEDAGYRARCVVSAASLTRISGAVHDQRSRGLRPHRPGGGADRRGSGIGKATALTLAGAGATIVGGDIDEARRRRRPRRSTRQVGRRARWRPTSPSAPRSTRSSTAPRPSSAASTSWATSPGSRTTRCSWTSPTKTSSASSRST